MQLDGAKAALAKTPDKASSFEAKVGVVDLGGQGLVSFKEVSLSAHRSIASETSSDTCHLFLTEMIAEHLMSKLACKAVTEDITFGYRTITSVQTRSHLCEGLSTMKKLQNYLATWGILLVVNDDEIVKFSVHTEIQVLVLS